MRPIYLMFLLSFSLLTTLSSQNTCATAVQLCGGLTLAAQTSGGAAESGPNYGCLGSVPNPTWIFVKVGTGGTLSLSVTISPNADVDFAAWGPFTTETCGAAMGAPIACDYSGANGGTANLGTVTAGSYYMILITNYTGSAGNISVNSSGTATLLCPGPGGVASSAIWLKANTGVTTGATFTWADQSGNGRSGTQTSATNQPTYTSSSINFNPAVTFDGTNDRLNLANLAGLPTGTATVEAFAVARNNNTAGSWMHIISYGGSTGNTFFTLGKNTGNANAVCAFNGTDAISSALEYAGNIPALTNGKYDGSTGYISSSGVQRNSVSFVHNKQTTAGRIGSDPVDAAHWNGDIAEAIIYTGNLSASNVLKVNSYLALKYGITLDQTTATNYVGSDWNGSTGTIYWTSTSNTGYKNNIAGIVSDDLSVLTQKQSRSVNSGLQVVIGNGNTIAANNAANSSTFSADKSALVWGDNAASVAAWSASGAPASREIIARAWKVQETGTIGSVKVQVADNGGSNGLPAENNGSVYLLVDADGNFASGATEVAMTLNGTNWEANYDFSTGQYFTFATQSSAPPVLVLSMSSSPANGANVNSASSITYTLTVTNSSAGAATNVRVKDQLPGGVTYVSASPSSGTYNASTGIWTIPTVTNGSPQTLSITVTVQ